MKYLLFINIMKNLIVAKFGGTSMGNAESIRQVAEIVKSYDSIVTVVSATSGTTDQLIELGEKALADENWEESFQKLVEKHEKITKYVIFPSVVWRHFVVLWQRRSS